jgi:serine/threonine-protein kinase HipA
MPYARKLHVFLMDVPAAVVREGAGGRLRLSYTSAWRDSENAQSISLSLPYTQTDHTHRPVLAYMSNLLPDNQNILEGWAAVFGVSSRNPFGLLAHMGEDCAGAVQFVREERLDAVLASPGSVDPISEDEIAAALARIRRNAAPWGDQEDRKGMFSLAGAQAKIALAKTDTGWGRPNGRAASTHILKPPADSRFPGIEINEHVCLNLARRLGIPAAASSVERFGDQVAIVVERFDRLSDHESVRRLHQEDTCQALGIPPSRKYQHAGGPGLREMAELVRTHSADPGADLQHLLGAAALNWIIGVTDGHAKNYSWFITAGDEIRTTPLYDLISSLLYYDLEDDDLRMAMTIGGETRILRVRREHWFNLAEIMGAEREEVVRYVRDLAEAVPAAVAEVVEKAADDGLEASVLDRLRVGITRQAQRCSAILA